jgi:hypothetical protein
MWNSYFTTQTLRSSLQFVFNLLTTSPSSEYYYWIKDLQRTSYLSKGLSEDISTLLNRFLSLAYRCREMVFAFKFWFKGDHYFPVMTVLNDCLNLWPLVRSQNTIPTRSPLVWASLMQYSYFPTGGKKAWTGITDCWNILVHQSDVKHYTHIHSRPALHWCSIRIFQWGETAWTGLNDCLNLWPLVRSQNTIPTQSPLVWASLMQYSYFPVGGESMDGFKWLLKPMAFSQKSKHYTHSVTLGLSFIDAVFVFSNWGKKAWTGITDCWNILVHQSEVKEYPLVHCRSELQWCSIRVF